MNIKTITHCTADFRHKKANIISDQGSSDNDALKKALEGKFPISDTNHRYHREIVMPTESIEFRIAWWFRLYIFGVTIMCLLTDCEPRQEKSLYWCQKALRVSYNGKCIKILRSGSTT